MQISSKNADQVFKNHILTLALDGSSIERWSFGKPQVEGRVIYVLNFASHCLSHGLDLSGVVSVMAG